MEKRIIQLLVLASSIVALSSCNQSSDHGSLVETGNKTVYRAAYDEDEMDYYPVAAGELVYGISSSYGEEKAMVSLNSYLEKAYLPAYSLSTNVTVRSDGDELTYAFSDSQKGTMVFDFSDYTITFSNFTRVNYGYEEDVFDAGTIALETSFTEIDYASSSIGFVEKGEATVFDLRKYDLPLYRGNLDVYLPIELANYFFLTSLGYSIVYNGSYFYSYQSNASLLKTEVDELSSFGEAFYGGALSRTSTKSGNVARLDANIMLFYLDHFYGFRDRDDLSDGWGSYLRSSYPSVYEGLYSRIAEEHDDAVDAIMRTIIGDGHTGTSNSLGLTGSFYNGGRHINEARSSDRTVALSRCYAEISALREEELGENYLVDHRVESSGETGIIRFDDFISGYVHPGDSQELFEQFSILDNYALFVTAFRNFNANGNIKRIVIDLTCNGGGMITSALTTLGFLMDEVPYATYNPLTGDMAKYAATVDVNADGVISGHESYADKYEFYVLTSNYSFSCGNLFPALAKEAGIPIIGEKSAGGACAVQNSIAPSGQAFQISGTYRFSNGYDGGAAHIDEGIEVDHELAKEYWYDIEALDGYLANLS